MQELISDHFSFRDGCAITTMTAAMERTRASSAMPSTRPARPWSSPARTSNVSATSIAAMAKMTVAITRMKSTARRTTPRVQRVNLPAQAVSVLTSLWSAIRCPIVQMPATSQRIASWTSALRSRSISVDTSASIPPPDITAIVMLAISMYPELIAPPNASIIKPNNALSDYWPMERHALTSTNAWSNQEPALNIVPIRPAVSIASVMSATMSGRTMSIPANERTTSTPGYCSATNTMCAICPWMADNII